VSAENLKRFALLEELSGEERELLDEHLELEELAEGRVLFEQGDEAEGLLLVVEGEVILESQEQGKLGRFGPGAALGGLSLVTARRREATALAASSCSVALLERGSFRRLVDDAPLLGCRLMEALLRETARQLREALPALRQALPSAPNDGHG
jgi:CRP-like cAMP-binding protein